MGVTFGKHGRTAEDVAAQGKALRLSSPRDSWEDWTPRRDAADAVRIIEASNAGRTHVLVPIRMGRMVASPFAFLRGSADVMANDLLTAPDSGLRFWIGGDAHCANFGTYETPERTLVVDMNDFDEADVGPWEWDVLRLAASLYVLGRQNGCSEDDCFDIARASVREYRSQMAEMAQLSLLDAHHVKFDAERVVAMGMHPETEKVRLAVMRKAARKTAPRTAEKLTEDGEDGRRRFRHEPPLLERISEEQHAAAARLLDGYLRSLQPAERELLAAYTALDAARKVVGVGSVGLGAYVVLLEGNGPSDLVVLQVKQARHSVLANAGLRGCVKFANQGRRVVEGQKRLQTAHDAFLGWAKGPERDWYVRQLADGKAQAPLEDVSPVVLSDLARLRGAVLAKAHARTGDAPLLAAYLGKSGKFEKAMAVAARTYADRTEADHAAFSAAVRSGKIEAVFGV